MRTVQSSASSCNASDIESNVSDLVVEDILQVATREFAAYGLAGSRIEKIQQQTRTSKRMIYYHFGSKEGLYRAVIERAFELAREVDKNFDPEAGSPEQALKRIGRYLKATANKGLIMKPSEKLLKIDKPLV